MNQAIHRAYQVLAWIIFVGVVLQFFLAGVGVFRAGSLGPHRMVGNLLIYAAIVLLILAVVSIVSGGLDRWRVGLTVVLVVLLLLQSLLASDFLQDGAPVISALHPVNGLLLVYISYTLAHGRGLPWTARTETREEAAVGSSRVR
jgi:peptidoglycan/LPS O-acetylase OafA/YrhL